MTRHAISVTAFVSLLLNVLLIGVIVGHIYSGIGRPHHVSHSKRIESVLAQLPEKKALWYKEAVRTARKNQWEKNKAIKTTRNEAVAILVAEQFDAGAFKKKLQQLDELGAEFKHQKMAIIIQFADQLDVSERRSLSTFLLKDRRLKNKP